LNSFLRGAAGEALAGHRIVAEGHRVVHRPRVGRNGGGMEFTEPVLVDANTLVALERLVPLAPLQQPHNLAAIRAVVQHAPELPQVACFDTSFHRTRPLTRVATLVGRFGGPPME
jgi:acetate kinase